MKLTSHSGFRITAAVLVMVTASIAYADELCKVDGATELVQRRSHAYSACGFPAASVKINQIAIAETGEFGFGSSSCMSKVCVFNALNGNRLRDWDIESKPTVNLAPAIAPLIEALRSEAFRPMKLFDMTPVDNDEVHTGERLTVRLHRKGRTSFFTVSGKGYSKLVHRFKTRTMQQCHEHPPALATAQTLHVWGLEGFPALVVLGQYYGAEMWCSWTEWVVVPLKPSVNAGLTAK